MPRTQTTPRLAEAIVNTPGALQHPGLGDDSRFVREVAIILKAQLADRTGDYIDLHDVARPIARVLQSFVEAYVDGGLR